MELKVLNAHRIVLLIHISIKYIKHVQMALLAFCFCSLKI